MRKQRSGVSVKECVSVMGKWDGSPDLNSDPLRRWRLLRGWLLTVPMLAVSVLAHGQAAPAAPDAGTVEQPDAAQDAAVVEVVEQPAVSRESGRLASYAGRSVYCDPWHRNHRGREVLRASGRHDDRWHHPRQCRGLQRRQL